jgi:hypothetical protein
MKWRRPIIAWALPALVACGAAASPPGAERLVKIAEIQLSERLAALGRPHLEVIRVAATSSSPDGGRLAIAFGDGSDSYVLKVHPEPPTRYLLVIPVAKPETTIHWRDVTALHLPWEPLSDGAWSPDGNFLGYANLLIRLPGGETCKLPTDSAQGIAGFLGPASLLIRILSLRTPKSVTPPGPHNTYGIVDSQCVLREKWTTDRPLSLPRVSPDGRLVAFFDYKRRNATDLILLPWTSPLPDQAEAELTSRRLALESGRIIHVGQGSRAVFVAGAVCQSVNLPGGRQARNFGIRCWDTRTGKQVRSSRAAWSGRVSLSAGGGLVAIMDSGLPGRGAHQIETPNAIGSAPRANVSPILPVRSLWDFKSGKIIAQWSAEPEAGTDAGLPRRTFVISPDGHMVADPGTDSVDIYRVQ